MQNQKIIEQLGYTAKEARVYLVVLNLGEAHISDIAAKVKMPRSSVQLIVEKLHEDGLMNFYVMKRYKYWVAEGPERLLLNLKKREESIREALPKLTAIRKAGRSSKKRGKNHEKSVAVFRMIADASPQPVLIANYDVEIEYVNTAWQEQFGYSLDEVRGENPRIFQSGKTPRAVHEYMWSALGSGTLFQSDEIIDRRKDGTFFNLLTTVFPVAHGDRTFYIQILDDITEKKRVQNLQKNFIQVAQKSVGD